jgi:hypothetical protein
MRVCVPLSRAVSDSTSCPTSINFSQYATQVVIVSIAGSLIKKMPRYIIPQLPKADNIIYC